MESKQHIYRCIAHQRGDTAIFRFFNIEILTVTEPDDRPRLNHFFFMISFYTQSIVEKNQSKEVSGQRLKRL